jgi:hypothetical protein
MNPSVCPLKSILPRSTVGAGNDLSHFRQLQNSSHLLWQMLLKQLRRAEIVSLLADLGIPENVQAPLPKISIRSQIRQIHLYQILEFC